MVTRKRHTEETLSARRSRRAVLRATGDGLAIAAAALLARPADAQADELPDVASEFLAAWEVFDPVRIATTFTDDGVREDIIAGVTAQGRAEVLRPVTTVFAAFEGASVAHPAAFAAGDRAVESWDFSDRYTSALPGLSPGVGKDLPFRRLTLINMAAGLIKRTADFYDRYGILVPFETQPPLSLTAKPEAEPRG